MYVYICIYIYMYIYVCMYVYIYICIYSYTPIHIGTYIYTHITTALFYFLSQDLFATQADRPFLFPPKFTFVFRAFSTIDGIGKVCIQKGSSGEP